MSFVSLELYELYVKRFDLHVHCHPDVFRHVFTYSSTQLYSYGIIWSLWVILMTCIDTYFKYVPTIWRFNRLRAVAAVPSLERLAFFGFVLK
jgi:hypothetical protein